MISWEWFTYNKQLELPTYSGVYAIETETGICYIGKAINISKRIYSHRKFIEKIETTGFYLKIGVFKTEDYKNLEKEAILFYKPLYNCTHKEKYRPEIAKQVKQALDGRLLRWLSFKAMIAENDLSQKMTGKKNFTQKEIDRINEQLKCNIIL